MKTQYKALGRNADLRSAERKLQSMSIVSFGIKIDPLYRYEARELLRELARLRRQAGEA